MEKSSGNLQGCLHCLELSKLSENFPEKGWTLLDCFIYWSIALMMPWSMMVCLLQQGVRKIKQQKIFRNAFRCISNFNSLRPVAKANWFLSIHETESRKTKLSLSCTKGPLSFFLFSPQETRAAAIPLTPTLHPSPPLLSGLLLSRLLLITSYLLARW